MGKGCHFYWGCADDVFTEAWGRQWAEMNADLIRSPTPATFRKIPGSRLAELILEGKN